MATLRLEILGRPKPKERPRLGKNGVFFTPKATVMYENLVKTEAYAAMRSQGVSMFQEPVEVAITAYFPIPDTLYNTKKKREETPGQIARGELLPAKKPDIDNIVKAIMDGLNGVAYRDDALVCSLHSRKVYGDMQRTLVEIRPIKGDSYVHNQEFSAQNREKDVGFMDALEVCPAS